MHSAAPCLVLYGWLMPLLLGPVKFEIKWIIILLTYTNVILVGILFIGKMKNLQKTRQKIQIKMMTLHKSYPNFKESRVGMKRYSSITLRRLSIFRLKTKYNAISTWPAVQPHALFCMCSIHGVWVCAIHKHGPVLMHHLWDRFTRYWEPYVGLNARKPVFGGLRTTQAQTSLRIRAVWSAPLFFAFCKVSHPDLPQAKVQLSS